MSFLRPSPAVTLGIPSYNAVSYLETCLQSIADQDYDPRWIEVLLIDDGSQDDTVPLAKRLMKRLGLRGKVLQHENTGSPAKARNVAIEHARGEWLYFLDVDDYLGPQAIRSMLDLGSRESADIVIGKYVGVGRGVPKVMFRETLARTNVQQTPLIDSLSVLKMYRTEYIRALPYRFNPSLRMAEDHPFALSAYAHTDRVAVQADTDCYYWVKHETDAARQQHLTGHVLSVDQFYPYMYESFAVLDQALEAGAPFAAYSRDRYWHRLLSFDIPIEMRRAHTPEGLIDSIAAATELTVNQRALDSEHEFSARSRAMLRALQLGDVEMIRQVARII